MNKLYRILCLLLTVLLMIQAPLLSLAEGEQAEFEAPEELIVGHPTITKGDFFTELFGNDTADIDVRALMDEGGKLTLVGSGLNIADGISVPDGELISQKTLADIGGEAGAK